VLAQRYLGDRAKRWWIAEFNAIDEVRSGQTVVIPLKAANPSGVYANGYLTVPVLCYHRFGSKPSQLAVTPAAFEAQMDYLAKNGYQVIPLSRLIGFLERGEPVPRKSVVLTIDDGYRSTYEIAFPILRKHGFPATVFLYGDFVGAPDALTWPQMKEMEASGLVSIQPHSKTHANLTLRLPGETDAKYRERMRSEIDMPIRLQDHITTTPAIAPSGPPLGTNFSRRKLTEPRPPVPACANTFTRSTNMRVQFAISMNSCHPERSRGMPLNILCSSSESSDSASYRQDDSNEV